MSGHLKAGMRVDRYCLEEYLGSGSSGLVWRARRGVRTVAIKFLRLPDDAAAAELYRQRLRNEANALRRLRHPHVPTLFDYKLNAAPPYLVMQYISTPSYDVLISSGRLFEIALDKRLRVLEVIATTLMAAHELGIVHRDIKPGNISGVEIPYLMDFSIALESGQEGGAEVGTGIYMPPAGEPADELGDCYAFGLVAYELLFGRHPIFTPGTVGKTVTETRRRAADVLHSRAWRLPSGLPPEELPGDLRGADLVGMEAAFEKILGPREARYRHPLDFVNDLKGAALLPSNAPYLIQPLHPPYLLARPAFPAKENYTAHEVANAELRTNPAPEAAVQIRPPLSSLLLLGLALCLVAGLLAVFLLRSVV